MNGGSRTLAAAVPAIGLLGAALLLAAEFTTLYSVHTSVYQSVARTVSTGSHDGYALVPIALLAAVLAAGPARRRPAACVALLVTGLVALGIALIGDLPDTRVRGLTAGLALASSTPGAGLYLETLGAIAILFAGGLGAFLSAPFRRTTA